MELEGLKFERRSDQLFIHFDVAEHYLKLETFVETAKRAQRIVDALDQTFFQGELKYELIVLPPEPGTFLTRLAIYLASGGAAIFGFLETDIGKAYVEGLTGNEPAHWSRELGENHRELIEKKIGTTEDTEPERETRQDVECRVGAQIITEMTRGILEVESADLERLGMDTGNLPDAIEARNEFYEVVIADPEVKAVGFAPEDEFPIPRNAFPERAIKVRRNEDDEEIVPWSVEIANIFVTSPNWDKDDQASRQWKGKEAATRRECFFVIEDEEFWFHVKKRDLQVEVLDNLKVQWAFQAVGIRKRNRRVLRVLEFNGELLAEPLGPEAMAAILGAYTDEKPNGEQGLLL